MFSPAVVTRLCPCLPLFFFFFVYINVYGYLSLYCLCQKEVLIQVEKNYACSLGVFSHIEIMWQKRDNDVGVAVPEGINVFFNGTNGCRGCLKHESGIYNI